ncbi:MAG: hypothetical protein AAB372_01110 [Patescibacteria group bacterium]
MIDPKEKDAASEIHPTDAEKKAAEARQAAAKEHTEKTPEHTEEGMDK